MLAFLFLLLLVGYLYITYVWARQGSAMSMEGEEEIAVHELMGVGKCWLMVIGGLVMIVTGFALYAEQTGLGTWQDELFGWLIPLMGQSQDVRTWHHWGMWIIVVFVMLHVYVAIREDIMSRQSLISTMVSGWRMFKDDQP